MTLPARPHRAFDHRSMRPGRTSGRVNNAVHAQAAPLPPLASWTAQLSPPAPESRRSRRLARSGGLIAVLSLLTYLIWRATCTLPSGSWNWTVGIALLCFETMPLLALSLRLATLWDIDSPAPTQGPEDVSGLRVAVLIPTYNESAEVIAPTIAAAVALQPAHETWVLDDGDRSWVAQMCAAYGARYVTRPVHDHAKAGNLNHAMQLMANEEHAGHERIDIIAVVDCDHVPLPSFLTATLGWFVDERVALVQAPQTFYNAGAFDDDGRTGEQGLFFNVQMRARHRGSAAPFWCGTTSLLRVAALREVGGVATETIIEDMHTTLKLIRNGWRTVYHHQTLALGLAPASPDQYLLQRRRWGLGAMQILVHERLWTAKRWLTWRNYYDYLTGCVWWLEGVATLVAFTLPVVLLASGARTTTAGPGVFAAAFTAMFAVRLWGSQRLMRGEIHWPTAFALRVFRIPIGCTCLWWLVTRKTLRFEVTPKGSADERRRGSVPRVLTWLTAATLAFATFAVAGASGLVPWRSDLSSTVAAGGWLAVAVVVLTLGVVRIRSDAFATSRRGAHRFDISVPVTVDGMPGVLVDVSVGGASVRLAGSTKPANGLVEVCLPGAQPIVMNLVGSASGDDGRATAVLQSADSDWQALRELSLWLFHTPDGVVASLPQGTPAVALRGAQPVALVPSAPGESQARPPHPRRRHTPAIRHRVLGTPLAAATVDENPESARR